MDQVDELAVLPSRERFLDAADALIARARAARVHLQLVHIDVDGLPGGAALRCMVNAVRASFRSVDPTCRVGGDALVVLCAGKAEAAHLRDRILDQFAVQAVGLPGPPMAVVTVYDVDWSTTAEALLDEVSARLTAAGRRA